VPLEVTERAAVGMLQVLLNDSLVVMRNEEYHPDARLHAQRIAHNIIEWNAVTGPLQYSVEDVRSVRDKIRYSGGGG